MPGRCTLRARARALSAPPAPSRLALTSLSRSRTFSLSLSLSLSHQLNGQTGLHFCHAYNEEKLSKYLVSKGADDGITNFEGMTCYEGLSRSAVEGL